MQQLKTPSRRCLARVTQDHGDPRVLECGLFKASYPALDKVTFGPTIQGAPLALMRSPHPGGGSFLATAHARCWGDPGQGISEHLII
jgi:hypothetical protein